MNETVHEIIVNAKKYPWNDDNISYEHLLEIAGLKIEANPTVTYFKAKSNDSGTLIHGQKQEVSDGIVFDVVVTGNA